MPHRLSPPRRALVRRDPSPAAHVLSVPRQSPQRAMHALRAFVKPHDWTRDAVRHRLATDPAGLHEHAWQDAWAPDFFAVAAEAAGRLGVSTEPHARTGDHLALRFGDGVPESHARAVALACSARFPRTWMQLGRLWLIGGTFWRRERGYRLHLRRATDVHLPRPVRALLGEMLRPLPRPRLSR